MTTIGFIGSGNIGATLARLFLQEGHDVVMSNSRGPGTLADLVADLGAGARAATVGEAAEQAQIAVVTIPLRAYRDVPVEPLADKIIIDTTNYYPERDGRIPELDDESTTTSELLAAHLPSSHVVKMFNTIYFGHLAAQGRPPGSPDRRALPMAGEENAMVQVQALVESIGFDVVDAGPLPQGWRFQRDTPAYVVGGDVAQIRGLLAEAKRYAEMTDDDRRVIADRVQAYFAAH